MKFAVYVLVVEDTNENAELLGLNAGTMMAILDIETEEQAIEIAKDAEESGRATASLLS